MKKESYHGMTSEMASHKKIKGHAREKMRKIMLGEGAEIIEGNGKSDIKKKDGKTESVKGGKKTQWALYGLLRMVNDDLFGKEELSAIERWVNFIPEKEEYFKNKSLYSNNPNAIDVYNVFKDNPIKLVDYFCGVNLVDYLVILDERTNEWLEFTMNEFSKKIKQNIKRIYFTSGGKIVIAGGPKDVILFEMELRKGENSHKRILFHSKLHTIIDCIK